MESRNEVEPQNGSLPDPADQHTSEEAKDRRAFALLNLLRVDHHQRELAKDHRAFGLLNLMRARHATHDQHEPAADGSPERGDEARRGRRAPHERSTTRIAAQDPAEAPTAGRTP